MYPRLGLFVLVALCASACATSGAVPRPFPGAAVPGTGAGPATASAPETPRIPDTAGSDDAPTVEPPPAGTFEQPLVTIALSYRGVPYRNGGSDPTGFDCSGFVQWVFARAGRQLPREVRDQYELGKSVERDDIRAGDLVFFETVSRGASHVGIALGGDEFVHAPSSNGVVRVERYTIDYWKRRFVGARRIN